MASSVEKGWGTKLSARLLAIVATISAASGPAVAASDEQLWASGGATVKLSDDWRLSQEVTVRFSDDEDGLYEIESNTLLGYRLNDIATVWAGYTHDPQYSSGDFRVMEHRAREQVTFDDFVRIGGGTLDGRIRTEQRWREGVDGTGWRFRPYLKYSLPVAGETAVNFSVEPFFNLNTTAFQDSGFDKIRNLVTVSTPLTETLKGEAGYMNQHGFVSNGPDTSDNIAYFSLSLRL
jgi:hypothetical protein